MNDSATAQPSPAKRAASSYFLPDFCEPRMVLAVVLVAELLAVVLAIGRSGDAAFLSELAKTSVFVQWGGLICAATFCSLANPLRQLSATLLSLSVFALTLIVVAVLSGAAVAIGHWLAARGLGAGLFPLQIWPFVFQNIVIAAIVCALLLRYFFVSHQWRRHVRAEASARIDALHARIRPHFLFNSLNTIAALTRSDAPRAEEAIEDLADLFRATLRESDAMITLKEELELARIYQRMEGLRLGDRLRVRWNVGELPMRFEVPSLTIQPLLENAINHGVEPLAGGGEVIVDGAVDDHTLMIAVSNPVAEVEQSERRGNRIALENIRARLQLAYGQDATMDVVRGPSEFRVEVRLPRPVQVVAA